jgi:hypothetical protein
MDASGALNRRHVARQQVARKHRPLGTHRISSLTIFRRPSLLDFVADPRGLAGGDPVGDVASVRKVLHTAAANFVTQAGMAGS